MASTHRDRHAVDTQPAVIAAPGANLSFRLEELDALEPEWNGLLEQSRCANVFLTWEWASAWWSSLGRESRPWILSARIPQDGVLVGLAPLCVARWPHPQLGPLRSLAFLGSNKAAPDHLDLIAMPEHARGLASELAMRIRARQGGWDLVDFSGLSADSLLLQSLMGSSPSCHSILRESVCPFLKLPGTWEEMQSGLDGKFRYNLRSRARRLARDATKAVRFRKVSNEEEIPRALATVFRLHQSIRRQRGDKGAFADPGMVEFHGRLARSFHRRGWLRLYLLEIGVDPIAASYCYRYGDTVSFYQTGYEARWAKYGPGAAIIEYAIRQSIKEGAKEFDFLRGTEPYKFRWTGDVRMDLWVRAPQGIRGTIALAALKSAGLLRRRIGQGRQTVLRALRRKARQRSSEGA